MPIAEIMLAVAMVLQCAAVCLVFRFLHYSVRRVAWVLIVSALLLMAGQTFVMLYRLIDAGPVDPSSWVHALITLAISALFFGGVLMTGPAIRNRYDRLIEVGASMAIMENLLAHSPSFIGIRDLDGRFILVNDSYERAYGKKSPRNDWETR